MAGSSATVTVNVVTDASKATKGLDDTRQALDKVGQEAKTASDKIDSVGGTAGKTTSGLRDMADAVGMIGFPGLAAGMGVAATGFEAIDGAATLFAATSGILKNVLGKVTVQVLKLAFALWANPIFLIAAVIITIIAVFVLLYVKCETFRKIVNQVFGFVWDLIKGFWDFLKACFAAIWEILKKPFELWKSILSTIIGWVTSAFQAWWGLISGIFSKVLNVIKGPFETAFNWVKNAIVSVKDKLADIVENIKDVFSGVFDAIKKPFEKAINWVKDHFHMPSLPSWLPGIGKSASSVYVPAARVGGTGVTSTAGGGITIVFNGPVGDPHAVTRQLRRMFRDDESRLGRLRPGPVGV